MWKPCGYIVHIGEYPVTAKYLIYDSVNNEVIWTDDCNAAMIFSTREYAKSIITDYSDVNINDCKFRIVVMTDEPVGQ